jgi:hypothetical protein
MSIIRFSTEEVFGTDSQEYDILYNAVKHIKGVDGAVIEIGTRRGGSAKLIIDTLVENQDTNRFMGCIDPYGNIDLEITNINASIHYPGKYQIKGDPMSLEESFATKFDYTNDMRNRTIPSLYYCAYEAGLYFTFFQLEDHEFFQRYKDGVPVYNEQKHIINEYAFVFFDGPHTNEAVEEELDFFLARDNIGTIFVFDDIWMYDHDKFEHYMFEHGYEILDKGNIKASYKKVA